MIPIFLGRIKKRLGDGRKTTELKIKLQVLIVASVNVENYQKVSKSSQDVNLCGKGLKSTSCKIKQKYNQSLIKSNIAL